MNARICTLHFAFALMAMFILDGCRTVHQPAWQLPPGVSTLQTNGYPMAFTERGSGPTVVLVHGALNDYRAWTPQLDALSSNFRVVSVSLRHYYPEPWKGDGEFSLKLHARDVAEFVDRLGAGPVVLVGWSRGGAVAVDTARMRPDLVRKLVLMDPGLFSLLQVGPRSPKNDPRLTRAKATEVHFRRGDIEGGLSWFFDDINGAGAWSRLPEAQRQLRRENAWTIVGQLGDVETVTCADIGQLKMPVLLLEGQNSPQQFKSIRGAVEKCLPAARLVTIAKANHQMHQTNTPDFNAALAKFISE
jgi:esterase